jgi:hypothetical protein
MRPLIVGIVLQTTFAIFTLAGCGKSTEEKNAHESALNSDSTILSSCSMESVTPFSIATLSRADTSNICEKMNGTLGKPPSVRLLRELSKTVSTLHMIGRSSDPIGDAYQFMRIVQSRGQLKSDDAMIGTFNIVFKIVNGTDGRVKPKDVNITLSQLGRGAETISDEGLVKTAALLSVMKQDKGE